MVASSLVGVWLLTATWFNIGAGEPTPLSEPYSIQTYDTQAECEANAASRSSELSKNQDDLLQLLSLIPGSNAIGFMCTKQAVEM